MTTGRSLLIVGNPDEVHVGAHLLAAARTLGLSASLADVRHAYHASWPVRKALWWLDRRPPGLRQFGREVVARAQRERPALMIVTGLAPVPAEALRALGEAGVLRVNVLTDDPWNPAHRARWFLDTLCHYDHVFTPRMAVEADLRQAGLSRIHRLDFAYNPTVHFPEPPPSKGEAARYACDVLVVGGADADRVALLRPLLDTSLAVRFYGRYWTRFAATRDRAGGVLDAAGLRQATGLACTTVVMVRRANRDDHTMRTFEAPAMRGCLIAERTAYHQALFGSEDDRVRYFGSGEELAACAAELVRQPEARERLARRSHALITGGRHSYADRLSRLLEVTS